MVLLPINKTFTHKGDLVKINPRHTYFTIKDTNIPYNTLPHLLGSYQQEVVDNALSVKVFTRNKFKNTKCKWYTGYLLSTINSNLGVFNNPGRNTVLVYIPELKGVYNYKDESGNIEKSHYGFFNRYVTSIDFPGIDMLPYFNVAPLYIPGVGFVIDYTFKKIKNSHKDSHIPYFHIYNIYDKSVIQVEASIINSELTCTSSPYFGKDYHINSSYSIEQTTIDLSLHGLGQGTYLVSLLHKIKN